MASNSVVSHNWANQTGKATNGSNFFYEGQLLYSYGHHFVVGAITEDGKTALLNSKTYSNTTSKHQSYARSAVSHLNRIYCSHPDSALRGYHDSNLATWSYAVGNLMEKDIARCNLHKLVGELERVLASSRAYCSYFSIATPGYDVKAEEFINSLKTSPKWSRENELELTKHPRRAAAEAKKIAENLAKFRAGEVSWFDSSIQYLRLNGQNVCTSLGIRIKTSEFMLHYNRLLHKENLIGTTVGGSYTIRVVTDEYVKIGCHLIGRDELDSMAEQITKKCLNRGVNQ